MKLSETVFARVPKSLNGVSSKMREAMAPSGKVEMAFLTGSMLESVSKEVSSWDFGLTS